MVGVEKEGDDWDVDLGVVEDKDFVDVSLEVALVDFSLEFPLFGFSLEFPLFGFSFGVVVFSFELGLGGSHTIIA